MSTAYTTKMETRFSNLRTQFKKITLGVGHVYVIKAMQPATIFTHVIFPCNVKNTFLLHKAYAARHVVRQLLIKHLPWGPFLESPENFSGPKNHS